MLLSWILIYFSASLVSSSTLRAKIDELSTNHPFFESLTPLAVKPESSTVNGYFTIAYYDGGACDGSQYTFALGYKANSCVPSASSGSYLIVTLSSSSSCNGAYVTEYSDSGCQTEIQSYALSDACFDYTYTSVSYTCQSDVYAPADSYYFELFISDPSSCSSGADQYTASHLNYCFYSGTYGSESYMYQCSSSDVSLVNYVDDSCQTVYTTEDEGTINQCFTNAEFYGDDAAFESTCHSPLAVDSSNDDGSNSKPKALGISRVLWVFIGVAGIVFIFACVMIIRWLRRRNRPPTPPGEVKMVTLFPKDAAVRYAAPSEMRI